MKRFSEKVSFFLAVYFFLISVPTQADTLLLTNGRKVQGIVVSVEDDPSVVLEVGSGRMVFAREEVALITPSEAQEHDAMRENWLKKKLDTEAAFQLGSMQERLRTSEEQKLEALKPKMTTLTVDNGYLFTEVSVNDRPASKFLLDTGAPTVVLTKKTGEDLGILGGRNLQTGTVQIAGHSMACVRVRLDKVEVQGFWARNVDTIILTEEGEDFIFHQDILGMSYLENFHFEVNVKERKLSLSWQGT